MVLANFLVKIEIPDWMSEAEQDEMLEALDRCNLKRSLQGSAVKALKPEIKVLGAEPETAAPTALSFKIGSPQVFKERKSSFVDGAGSLSVLPRMWQRMEGVVDGCIVVSLDETKEAMRLMAEKARVISEGAGALALAAALSGKAGQGPIVAIVSGGNIDLKDYCDLIGNAQPR